MSIFIKKYFYPGRSLPFYILAVSLILFSGILGHFSQIGSYSGLQYRSLKVSFLLNSQQSVNFAIYYDVGRGFTEKDQQSKIIEQINEDVEISFCIPVYNRLKLLRFDPSKKYASMTIKKIVYSYDGGQNVSVPLENIQPVNQIQSHLIEDNGLSFITEAGGDDPVFIINKDLSPADTTDKSRVMHYLKYFMASLIALFVCRFIYLYFIKGI